MHALSVVIPAHNEENLIIATLDRLLLETVEDEFDVVVICNGCTDRTAERARSVDSGATVLETAVASKVHALNLGDRTVSGFPRLYLDADVALDAAAVRALAAAVGGDVQAAAPALAVDAASASWPVRSYVRIWSRLPNVDSALAGRGAFMLSEEGRQRFGEFPDVMADDLFIDRLFGPKERTVVTDVRSTVRAPRTLRDLLARKTRVFTANRQLAKLYPEGPDGTGSSAHTDRLAWAGTVRRNPRLVTDVPAYLLVTLTAKWRARHRAARQDTSWDRDLSTRSIDPRDDA